MMSRSARFVCIAAALALYLAAILFAAFFPAGTLVGGRGDYLVTFFAVFLSALWGATMVYRVQYDKVRSILVGIIVTSFLWLTMRYVKWLVNIPTLSIYIDYIYYVPMLLCPSLALWLVLDNFFPDRTWRQWVIALSIAGVAILSSFALTNDLHHLVYRNIEVVTSPEGVVAYTAYRYGAVHYVAMGFIALTAVGVFVAIMAGSRRRFVPRLIWLPILVAMVATTYFVGYAMGWRFIRETFFVKDLALVSVLFMYLVLELLLRIGLVQNNGRYVFNFRHSMLPMCIYDENGRPLYRGEGYPLPEEQKDGVRYGRWAVGEYTVSVKEDLGEVEQLRRKLSEESAQLEETNRLLTHTLEVAAESAALSARLALVDEIERGIGKSKEEMERLTASLPDEATEQNAYAVRQTLGRIALSLGYMKQKCMLLLGAKEQKSLRLDAMRLLAKVMTEDVKSVGFGEVAVVIVPTEEISFEYALSVNDRLNQVAKAYAFEGLDMLVALDPQKGKLTIELDGAKVPVQPLAGLKTTPQDNGVRVVWEGAYE